MPALKLVVRSSELVWLLVITPDCAAYCPCATTLVWTNHVASPVLIQGRCVRSPDSKPSVNGSETKLAVRFKSLCTTKTSGLAEEETSPLQLLNWAVAKGIADSVTAEPPAKSPDCPGTSAMPPKELIVVNWTDPPT